MAERREARKLLKEQRSLARAIDELEARPAELGLAAQADVAAARKRAAREQMVAVPVGRLRETAKGVRLEGLEDEGYLTVADILDSSEAELVQVPGIGETTARRLIAAARQLSAASEATARVEFDVEARPPEQTRLLMHLRRYWLAQLAVDRAQPMVHWFHTTVEPLAEKARPAAWFWFSRAFVPSTRKVEADAAVATLGEHLAEPNVDQFRTWLGETTREIERRRAADEIWADYEQNAAQLLGALDGLTGVDAQSAGRGHLPAEIVERVQAIDLDRSLLKVGLRGYQSFGARFAIAQGRTILGDEMGLGKTVEALGALCHLSAQGHTRAMVVCPASVVANWRAEILRHTHLTPHVVHGSGRDRAHERWLAENGVAITTYEGLHRLDPKARPSLDTPSTPPWSDPTDRRHDDPGAVSPAQSDAPSDRRRTNDEAVWLVPPEAPGVPSERRHVDDDATSTAPVDRRQNDDDPAAPARPNTNTSGAPSDGRHAEPAASTSPRPPAAPSDAPPLEPPSETADHRHADDGGSPPPPGPDDPRPPVPTATPGVAQPLAMLVVDEAHYVKNPEAQRSKAVARWAEHAERVLFLTGTPMENRVEEFQELVAHLQPDIGARVDVMTGLAGAAAFQTAVAPVYIRRNQSDVLDELPEMIPSFDWVEPTRADLDCYRSAVESDNFMAMRRAAYLSVDGDGLRTMKQIDRSAKLARLVDIVEEASEEGLKVLVFSFFRDVLELVHQALALVVPGAVYGPLTGSTPPEQRQKLIEALGEHEGSAVLVAQIEAGGVGLNIQSASVVVLCEPQWKPSTEAQAIARSHRMGQVRRVQVHRLLLEDSVDQRMLAVLAGKQKLIERFVHGSVIKDATPEAIDISDLDQVHRVVNETQAEAMILTAERRRLGLDQPTDSTPALRRARPDRPVDAPPR
jgi:superfamily II DNA or RNA helicase